MEYDLVIADGTYFDGSGAPSPGVRHVGIVGDRVVAVSEAPLRARAGGRVVSAKGRWVMPGFLDNHTHYDAELLGAPGLNESVRHGVTTVLVGSCSLSTIFCDALDCADFFSRVEALPREHVLPILEREKTWTTPAGYVEALEQRPLGPNVASFIGHSDLRTHVLGLARAVDGNERPSADELKRMQALLENGLDAGFLGMSSMTNPWDKLDGDRFRSRKLPSAYATWREYRALHAVLRRRERVLQSAPNITTKVNAVLFVLESAGFGVRKPLKTALITAADAKSSPHLATTITALTDLSNRAVGTDLRWQTVPVEFDVYADGMDLVVFEEFGAGEEALHLKDALERNELLKDEAYRRRFRRDYAKQWGGRVWQRDFYDAQIVSAPDATLVGKTFGAVADERGIHPVDLFLDLVVLYGTELRWHTVIANHRPDVLRTILSRSSVQPGFADSGAHVRNMAFYNFPLHLLRMARDAEQRGGGFLSVAQAVHRLTGEQAAWYNVDAGRLGVGFRADIAIIDPAGLDDALDAYHEAPVEFLGGLSRMVRRNNRACVGTVIAGEVVFEDGQFAAWFGRERRSGRFLRAGGWVEPEAETGAAAATTHSDAAE